MSTALQEQAPKHSRVANAAQNVFGLYWMSCLVVFPYFVWQTAHEYGFWTWLFLGNLIAAVKIVAWPYFLFFYR